MGISKNAGSALRLKLYSNELLLKFVSVLARTLQDCRTLYSKQSYVFVFVFQILTVFGGKMRSHDTQQNDNDVKNK